MKDKKPKLPPAPLPLKFEFHGVTFDGIDYVFIDKKKFDIIKSVKGEHFILKVK